MKWKKSLSNQMSIVGENLYPRQDEQNKLMWQSVQAKEELAYYHALYHDTVKDKGRTPRQ
jgi:hypothetical protein